VSEPDDRPAPRAAGQGWDPDALRPAEDGGAGATGPRATIEHLSGEGPTEAEAALGPPPRRRASLLARSPVFAAVALAASGWLVWDLSADAAYFFSPAVPIDLGGPGAYRLDAARPNRLVRVRGAAQAAVSATTGRGEERQVLGLAGANLVVDRPGAGGVVNVYEGRLLPRRQAGEYEAVLPALRERGFAAGERWGVVRDGERPRQRWSRPALAAVALLVAAVNLRALLRRGVE
jgi:hypothetical protein